MLDVANNISTVIYSIVSVVGAIGAILFWTVKSHFDHGYDIRTLNTARDTDKEQSDKAIEDLQNQLRYLKEEIGKNLEAHKKDTEDNMKAIYSKLDSIQICMTQLIAMTSRLEGQMKKE